MKIAVSGLSGKMGSVFARRIEAYPNHTLAFGLGRTEAKSTPPVYTSFADAKQSADVLVDFSRPEFLLNVLHECPSSIHTIITGTTGFSPQQISELKTHAKNKFIFHSSNFSIGVFALIKSIQTIASALHDWDVKIEETHHIHKKDTPSGTAKWMLQTLKDSAGQPDPTVTAHREGDVVGNHSIIFDTEFETLTLKHEAKDRQVFVDGVFTILDWITSDQRHRTPGFYVMEDYFKTRSYSDA